MKRKSVIMLLVAALVVAMGGMAVAQDQAANNMELVKQKIRTDKKLFIAENMQLTEDRAKAFWPVYDSYQAELEKIYDRDLKLIENYAENYETMTNETAKALLEEWWSIDEDRLKLRNSYLPKFRKVLPEIKVARYYQLENKIDAIVDYALATQIPLFK